jgi:hypothetical protein
MSGNVCCASFGDGGGGGATCQGSCTNGIQLCQSSSECANGTCQTFGAQGGGICFAGFGDGGFTFGDGGFTFGDAGFNFGDAGFGFGGD